jgi:hypothetical protein
VSEFETASILFWFEARIVGRDALSHWQTGIGCGRRALTLTLMLQVFETLFAILFARKNK